MKNKSFIAFALIVVIGLNIQLVFQLLLERQRCTSLSMSIVNENQLREQLLYSILLDETKVVLEDLTGESKPVLCYYVSDIHCNSFVDSLLSALCSFKDEYEELNIALLTNYKSKKDLNIFLRQNMFDGIVLDVNKKDGMVFKSEIPLMFIYHPNKHKLGEVFRPLLSDMKTTERYLNIVTEKYF